MSLTKRIIPCLDVDAGRVVKGVNFVGIRDAGDPVEIAQRYNQQGADEITFLDITASHEDRDTTVEMVERIAGEVFIPLTVGGGIRTCDDIRTMFNAGADKVSINTAAVTNPTSCAKPRNVLVASVLSSPSMPSEYQPRAKRRAGKFLPMVGVAQRDSTPLNGAKKMVEFGAGELLLTSMDRDGTKVGFDLGVTHAIAEAVSVPVVASGGVGIPGSPRGRRAERRCRCGAGRQYFPLRRVHDP